MYYAVTTHLKLPEVVFWCATHRKIVELLEIDKEVNTVKTSKNNKNNVTKPAKTGEKMSLKEAMKLL